MCRCDGMERNGTRQSLMPAGRRDVEAVCWNWTGKAKLCLYNSHVNAEQVI